MHNGSRVGRFFSSPSTTRHVRFWLVNWREDRCEVSSHSMKEKEIQSCCTNAWHPKECDDTISRMIEMLWWTNVYSIPMQSCQNNYNYSVLKEEWDHTEDMLDPWQCFDRAWCNIHYYRLSSRWAGSLLHPSFIYGIHSRICISVALHAYACPVFPFRCLFVDRIEAECNLIHALFAFLMSRLYRCGRGYLLCGYIVYPSFVQIIHCASLALDIYFEVLNFCTRAKLLSRMLYSLRQLWLRVL